MTNTPGKMFFSSVVERAETAWLIGAKVVSTEIVSHVLYLSLDNGGSIQAGSPWRILTTGVRAISSEDHEQVYGLPERIDAAQRAQSLLQGIPISSVAIDLKSLDLSVSFGEDLVMQVVAFSLGYEAWQLNDPKKRCWIGGGRQLLYCDMSGA